MVSRADRSVTGGDTIAAMTEWGPLQPLIGEWEGEGGFDQSYHLR